MRLKIIDLYEKILTLFCLLSVNGALVYYFYKLNKIGIFLALFLSISSFIFYLIIIKKNQPSDGRPQKFCPTAEIQKKSKSKLKIIYGLIYILLAAASFFILFKSRTDWPIISPWQVVSKYFFIFYFLASAVLILNILKQNAFTRLFIILHYGLSFTAALIVYKIGYGFDPFIHQATEKLIAQTGEVLPKPFYYLGQYALIVIAHKLTSLPTIWLDKLLVPVFAAVAMPLALYRALSYANILNSENNISLNAKINLISLFLLILPFSFFIVTTPQNLAYLFLILAVLESLRPPAKRNLPLLWMLSLASFFTQPIAGIPALLFSAILTIYFGNGKKIKYFALAILAILIIFALPAAFYILHKSQPLADDVFSENFDRSGQMQTNQTLNANKIFNLLKFSNPNSENIVLNLVYLYVRNLGILIILLVVVGFLPVIKNRRQNEIAIISSGVSAGLFISYFLTNALPFNFLIFYERSDYANRLLILAAIFLLPLFINAIDAIIKRASQETNFFKIAFSAFAVLLLTFSMYASYPRFDRYHNSRGYSTSKFDIEAVRWIEKNANNDYIVLANQQVSAAALREFGFKKYYQAANIKQQTSESNLADNNSIFHIQPSEIFFYPIPTGGPLYQYYLNMVYKKPARSTMEQAMSLTGVKESYFILNKYWWAFDKIKEETKLEADAWQEIGSGQIYIFKFQKNKYSVQLTP